ncbi:hypothetical protein HMPREF9501_03152 [Enterococcus faecalis TX0027]|nr:hypothetical protein HMPREF9501_03152 [Enterococcus faecalis TX0027]
MIHAILFLYVLIYCSLVYVQLLIFSILSKKGAFEISNFATAK